MTVRRRLTALALTTASVLAPAAALAAVDAHAASWRVIARKSAGGQFAIAAANGHANNPNQIAVNFSGGSPQGMVIIACTKGLGAVGSNSQYFTGAGTHTVKLPMGNPSSCDVTASASGEGRITVKILAR